METRKIIADYYCGIDLHAKTKYICVLNKDGHIMLKRNIKNNFQTFKQNLNVLQAIMSILKGEPILFFKAE